MIQEDDTEVFRGFVTGGLANYTNAKNGTSYRAEVTPIFLYAGRGQTNAVYIEKFTPGRRKKEGERKRNILENC